MMNNYIKAFYFLLLGVVGYFLSVIASDLLWLHNVRVLQDGLLKDQKIQELTKENQELKNPKKEEKKDEKK